MRAGHEPAIIAAIPYYRCRRYIRRAVEGLLAQTHRNLTVVVVNDADPEPPWDLLRGIADPRLLRFSLQHNHGPYFATAVVLAATSAPYFLIQDADDWSVPERASRLLSRLERDASDFAVSAHSHCTMGGSPLRGLRWARSTWQPSDLARFVIQPLITPRFRYRAPHHGLFRTEALRRIGGYYGGFRMSYDTLITNLMFMTGKVSHVAQPLYCRTVRPESLTQSAETGYLSPIRRRINAMIGRLYSECFRDYARYRAGSIDSAKLASVIRARVLRGIPAGEARELAIETARLRQLLAAREQR